MFCWIGGLGDNEVVLVIGRWKGGESYGMVPGRIRKHAGSFRSDG